MAVTGYFIDDDWNYREILIGFEPLHRTHSGVNLSAIFLDLLQQHHITDQVLTIITDNVSNNNTLMSSIQESVQSLNLDNNTSIIRVPCIVYVIQLSLKQLLGQMKANPKNEITEIIRSSVSINAATDKLADYYSKTDKFHGDLFAINTMFAPENKLHFFSGKGWDDNYDWRRRYRQSFENYMESYKQCLANLQTLLQAQPPSLPRSAIEMSLKGAKTQRLGKRGELAQYLEADTVEISPRAF
ncbi:uncharacterized protein KD926_009746 [Aspergillus affinis]|uniref:uncharacterized protein n=1 Tax=Aspergillus affinis TaxID=1070780 RepID=UPI0022FE3BAC|nr:uncharacterized protein KD926_009746 [Aspergillus affinis]KAI9039304.1 hypothetical protein KD926_009746 [Aspergillus affinis]